MTRPPLHLHFPKLALFLALAGWILAAGGLRAADRQVVLLPTTGVVDDAMAGYIEGGIATATRDGAAAVIVELDTPGGSLDATQRIVTAFLQSPVPVIVWVAPAGGWAASAGTFITLAGHVAVMAPGTSIGAASPVDSNGNTITGTEGAKVLQITSNYMRSIAEARHRNVDWAVSAVETAQAASATQAASLGVVDGVAGSIPEVLALATGKTVAVSGGPLTLDLAGASIRELDMSPLVSLLHLLADPNIAFLLLAIGLLGLFVEFQHPTVLSGVVGAIAVILAFVGFGSLPLNIGGLLLIGLGAVLFVLEAAITSHGILALAGVVSFALGASALYSGPLDPFEPVTRVALPLVLVTTITLAILMSLIAVAAARARRTGTSPGLVGAGLDLSAPAVVHRPLEPVGSVHVGGEEWTARSADGRRMERGTPVRVVEVDGLTLVVTPVSSSRP